MSASIRFDRVHRHFGETEVLRGLSLEVEPGQVYALLGRNGSGKTTALRILLGFLAPHAGTSSVLGVDSQVLTPLDRGSISYVGEDHRLYASMRVRDAVAFEAGTRPNFRREFVEAALDRCSLPRDRRIMLLSRGQRAQLALILSVGAAPRVLIFDDPALGLDAVMRRSLLDAMIDLLSEVGCAVLLSSHHLQDVERMADRVGVLHGGQLIVDAHLDDLKRRVQRRRWSGARKTAPEHDAVLAAHAHRDGFDLTLLDCDAAVEQSLCRDGGRLSQASTPTLEQLFLDLTATRSAGIFAPPALDTTLEGVS